MSLLALQIDPLHTLKPETDSSLFLGFEGQNHGFEVFAYTPQNLVYASNSLRAYGDFIKLSRDGYTYHITSSGWVDLGDTDLILIRQDPPFDSRYLANTYLLELLEEKGKRILNSPAGIRNACEKTLPLKFPDLIPETLITENPEAILDFSSRYGEIILKPLYGYGGHDVLPLDRPTPSALLTMAQLYLDKYQSPLIVQPLLKEVYAEEKRIHILNGKPVNIFRRKPKDGEVRANMAQGGTAEAGEFTKRDLEICERIAPILVEMGLYLVGIDVIGEYLMEINVTSPTGLRAAQKLYDINLAKMFFENIA